MNRNTSMPISANRLAEIAAIADEDIDTSDIPEAREEYFRKARLWTRPRRPRRSARRKFVTCANRPI